MKLSLIIPCYNEAKNIPLLLEKCSEFKQNESEVILVDNGSSDETQEVLNKHIQNYSACKSIRLEKNEGYGYGILEGLKEAKGDIIGWTHADLQTNPVDALRAISKFEDLDKNTFIKGKRYGRSFFDTFFTVGMSFFETILLKKFMWDINAQPTLFHKDFFKDWSNPPKDFSLDLYAYFHAKHRKYKVHRLPVLFDKRAFGESKWNFGMKSRLKFIKRTINYSFKLKKDLTL